MSHQPGMNEYESISYITELLHGHLITPSFRKYIPGHICSVAAKAMLCLTSVPYKDEDENDTSPCQGYCSPGAVAKKLCQPEKM